MILNVFCSVINKKKTPSLNSLYTGWFELYDILEKQNKTLAMIEGSWLAGNWGVSG